MNILCATDLLPKSDAAMERAGRLADQLAADLTLLHVVVPSESPRALEQTLHTALAHMRSRAQSPLWQGERSPAVGVRAGNPARVILESVARSKPGLLVLGPHRKRPLRDALAGTIAEKVLAARSCPVLIVQDDARTAYRRVLLALDFSDASASALRAAESLVLAPQMEARIVHIHQPPYQEMLEQAGVGPTSLVRYQDVWNQEAKRAIGDLLQDESTDPGRYEMHIEQGSAGTGILHAIEHYQPDLLVMGTQGIGRLHRALVGSVANRVLDEITCDALIVPEGAFGVPRNQSVSGERRSGARHERRLATALDREHRWGPWVP